MIGLDTSVVVRLLIGEPEAQARQARELIDESNGDRPSVSDLVVSEAYFALRHHYDVPHKQAIIALHSLLLDDRIVGTGVALEVLSAMVNDASVPGLMDRLIHADYDRTANADMVTFDRDAARLPRTRLLRS